MADENKVFGQQTQQPQEVSGEDALKLLVGEDGKYKSVEDLAKAALHGQTHIATLEDETSQLRDQLAKATHMEELVNELKQATGQPPVQDEAPKQDQRAQPPAQEPVNVEELIAQQLDARSKASTAKANVQAVNDALSDKLGAGAAAAFKATAERMNVDLDKLASESPQAVINLVLGQAPAVQQQPQGGGSFSGGHNRDQGGTPNGQHPMSKKAIQARFDNGDISRHEKIRLENDGLTQLGQAFWE